MSFKPKHRIPSLDGLRAISIIMVILGHSFGSFFKWVDIANLGVRVFFIISAYLIVGILLKDVERERFSIKRFYFKRLMRTFPAFYVYLVIVGVFLYCIGKFEFDQFWRALVYLENYHPRLLWSENQWFVGHSWSLAVEEQFYIVVAILFWFFNAKKITKKGLISCLLCIVILAPIIRILYTYTNLCPVLSSSLHRSFETVMDSIAMGGLAALVNFKLKWGKTLLSFAERYMYLLISVVFVIQAFNSSAIRKLFGLKFRYFYNAFGLSIINLCIVLLMVILIKLPNKTIFGRVLNTKPLIVIGMYSYSLYLWQQVWLFKGWQMPVGIQFLGIGLSAFLSYVLVEKPFLKLRDVYLANTMLKK
ncbi:MAG: acyltransferase family protein [Flavobacteriaceae bacterium]